MPHTTAEPTLLTPIAQAALDGLTATPKTLPPWLFYDEAGSRLFEQITTLPEYYLTRTERALLATHADAIVSALGAPVTIAELGAGTASKTGLLLAAATRRQSTVLYQPIDISPSALDEARRTLESTLPGVVVRPQVANYLVEPLYIQRLPGHRVLALYIGSSIGNFSPHQAHEILTNLRARLQPGDALLLGADLAPSPAKPVARLLAAYDDDAGVTAAFNRNVLTHLNHALGTRFQLDCFAHRARWNAAESRIEMHLESLAPQTVRIPTTNGTIPIHLAPGETIHTENSHKFTPASIAAMLHPAGFTPTHTFTDPEQLFAVTLATAL